MQYTDFLDLAQERYSVRKFLDRPVEKDIISKIMKSGDLAPTAVNFQPQKILIAQQTDQLTKLKKCTGSHFDAPLAFIVCYDKDRSWKRSYDGQDSGVVDASIVATHMMLEAANLGIGSTWVMHFDPQAVYTEFALPSNVVPVAILVMGYPHPQATPSPRHFEYRDEAEILL